MSAYKQRIKIFTRFGGSKIKITSIIAKEIDFCTSLKRLLPYIFFQGRTKFSSEWGKNILNIPKKGYDFLEKVFKNTFWWAKGEANALFCPSLRTTLFFIALNKVLFT